MNDLEFVREVVDSMRRTGLDVWLFGGWAEELREMRAPGPHSDIDLVLRANTFDDLDRFGSGRAGVVEILAKRLPHKRAFEWCGVRVEVFLLVPGPAQSTTAFDGRVEMAWPTDTFSEASPPELPIVSSAALFLYRLAHSEIARRRRAPSSQSFGPWSPEGLGRVIGS